MALLALEQALTVACPIYGVASSGRIDFRPEATAEQRTAASEIASEWDFSAGDWLRDTPGAIAAAKTAKIDELKSQYVEQQSRGVRFSCGVLAATEYDQRRFATMLVGINNAIEIGVMTAESNVTIWDVNGSMIVLPVSQFKLVAAQYMAGCMEFEMRLGNAIVAVQSAETQDDVEAVVL